jgi:hypothetical protein
MAVTAANGVYPTALMTGSCLLAQGFSDLVPPTSLAQHHAKPLKITELLPSLYESTLLCPRSCFPLLVHFALLDVFFDGGGTRGSWEIFDDKCGEN